MIGLLGKKIGMTQTFKEDGQQVPLTVIKVGPCPILDIRTKEKHGYTAVRLAFDPRKEKSFNRPQVGQFKKLHLPTMRFVREIRTPDTTGLEIGGSLFVDNFEVGDYVDIQGTSIGHGFQGVVKRLHYKGGYNAHGTKMGREPGSIGAKAGGRGCRKKVLKGKGLPGHMGDETVTIQNLQVAIIDKDNHLLAVKGTVPGKKGAYLVIKTAVKRGKTRKWKLESTQEKEVSKKSPEGPSQEAPQDAPVEAAKSESQEKKS
ncbi:MAG: 50S ribosomal protein L3 [Candidatus Omnitrophica bacterium]|nr:50S ribosomal protein L3 [Candidatus Omnitrophota bacterium]MDD5670929.1 50S ribosomal protein L3 [Candidatus Omnitrophota bacterium]